jgi:hypothetical protein
MASIDLAPFMTQEKTEEKKEQASLHADSSSFALEQMESSSSSSVSVLYQLQGVRVIMLLLFLLFIIIIIITHTQT